MRILIIAVLAILVAFSAHAAQPLLAPFYGRHPEITTQAQFIRQLESPALNTGRQGLVDLFNREFGGILGRVADFAELTHKLAGHDYTVEPCRGEVVNYGVAPDGSYHLVRRSCYPGEHMLVYRATERVFSLYCGNPQHPPPPPRRVSECVEIRVRLVGGSGSTPLVRLWGSSTAAGCGLRVVACDCVNVDTGQRVSAAFVAPAIRGGGGVILLPRMMVEAMTELCIEMPGYRNPAGTHDVRVHGRLAASFAARAARGEDSVQEGYYPEFLARPSS